MENFSANIFIGGLIFCIAGVGIWLIFVFNTPFQNITYAFCGFIILLIGCVMMLFGKAEMLTVARNERREL